MKLKCKHCNKIIKNRSKIKIFCSQKCQLLNWVQNNRLKLNRQVREYRKRRYQKDGMWRSSGKKAQELNRWMIEIKSNPCVDCNNSFPVCCMDFDHREGTTKEYNVGSMFAHHYSRELIEKELKKCDLVCSNCHRIRTQKRRTGSGTGGNL